MSPFQSVLLPTAVVLGELSLVYVIGCIVATVRWHRTVTRDKPSVPRGDVIWPSVAVLKPLCGHEPDLATNLTTFCVQTYPRFEVLMGTREANDPAVPIALDAASRNAVTARVVVGGRSLGPNQKVNTLAHLGRHTSADVVVIADSDVRVDPRYLMAIVEPLLDPSVGVVTCLYRGTPTGSLWSRFGALAINEWFMPSVLVSRAIGSETYCSGSTMAMRREVLDAIGGFEALAPLLADDHELGKRIRGLGLRSVVSQYEVETTVDEPTLGTLVEHELRWMRTIRTVQPLGHLCSVVTYTLPMTLLAALIGHSHPALWSLPMLAFTARLALHWIVMQRPLHAGEPNRGGLATMWLIPFRDLLSFGIWVASFANRRVVWRRQAMYVQSDGVLHGAEEVLPA